MKALAETARKRKDREPSPSWDALAAGELSSEDRAALAAEDPDGELADLFEPLGDDFVSGVLDDVLGAGHGEPSLDGVDGEGLPEGASLAPSDPGSESATEPLPAPANRRPWWLAVLVPLTLAAAVLLAIVAWPRSEPLPGYAFEISGGDQVVRGGDEPDAAQVLELSPGSRLRLVARPPTPVEGGVAASLLVGSDAELRAVPAQLDVSESGSVRWEGVAGQPPLTADVTQVVLVVHRPGASEAAVLDAARSGTSLPLQRVMVRIQP